MAQKVQSLMDLKREINHLRQENDNMKAQLDKALELFEQVEEVESKVESFDVPPDRKNEIDAIRIEHKALLDRHAAEITETRQWLADTGQAQQNIRIDVDSRVESAELKVKEMAGQLDSMSKRVQKLHSRITKANNAESANYSDILEIVNKLRSKVDTLEENLNEIIGG